MEIDMEKRLRDCTRHMENLDYTALSQEDIKKETEDILIQIGFLQNDLILCRIRSGVLIICAVLAVIAVLASQTLPFYIFGIIMQKFGLGFSNISSSDLVRYLKTKGYREEQIIEAGLATHGGNQCIGAACTGVFGTDS